jgi:hypothetical protein
VAVRFTSGQRIIIATPLISEVTLLTITAQTVHLYVCLLNLCEITVTHDQRKATALDPRHEPLLNIPHPSKK